MNKLCPNCKSDNVYTFVVREYKDLSYFMCLECGHTGREEELLTDTIINKIKRWNGKIWKI